MAGRQSMENDARFNTLHTILLTNLKCLDMIDVEGTNKIKYLYYSIISYLKIIRNLMELHKTYHIHTQKHRFYKR